MLDVAVKAPPCPAEDAPLGTFLLLLLHCDGHFRVIVRSLRDLRHLARQLAQEPAAQDSASVLRAIETYCEAKPNFYPPEQTAARLAVALETFVRQLVTNSELLATSLALKTFLNGNVLTSHETIGQSYRDAVERAIEAETEMQEEGVAAGCSVEQDVSVNVAEGEQLVLWKFASQGADLVFSAEFSSGAKTEGDEADPYSGSSNVERGGQEKEVVHYRTSCEFQEGAFVYGHFVAQKTGVVTLQWENASTSSVVSKRLQFQVKVVPLDAAESFLKIADGLNAVDTAEWLREHVVASEITSLEDVTGWSTDEIDNGTNEDTTYDSFAGEGAMENQMHATAMERRTHELEEQVIRLEESLTDSKKELKSARDRVQIAEEIYKANLETITQLEFATTGPAKAAKRSGPEFGVPTGALAMSSATLNTTQPEGASSSELERVQRLCADFQEQCLWRSVENMELETQLAASQVEASSWREKHMEQTTRLEVLDEQNRTLRSHKKLLVQEVKRLQPYSQVNLAALVQDAQEARMVQRSLQAKLDSRDLTDDIPISNDFVLVEASDDP